MEGSRRNMRQPVGCYGTRGFWGGASFLFPAGLSLQASQKRRHLGEALQHGDTGGFQAGAALVALGQQHARTAGLLGHLPVVEGVPYK